MARTEGGISVELWWWLDPFMYTSIVIFIIGMILCVIMCKMEFSSAGVIVFILCSIPFAVSVLSYLAWLLCWMFWTIWDPYLG